MSADNDLNGHLKFVTTVHHFEAIQRLVINDRHVIVQHIANIMSISIASVHSALTDILGMSKRIGNLSCEFEIRNILLYNRVGRTSIPNVPSCHHGFPLVLLSFICK